MNDNIFKDNEFLESLSERLKEPLRLAAMMEDFGIAQYVNAAAALPIQQITALDPNYLSGVQQLENTLRPGIENMYSSLKQFHDNITAIEAMMSTRFEEFVQPLYYLPEVSSAYNVINNFASAISNASSEISRSWMQRVNPWQTKVSCFVSYDASVLKGINNEFSKLVQLEQVTSGLLPVTNHFSEITSVTAQLASIETSLSSIAEQWRGAIVPFQFLDNYSHFASSQHKLIQKAAYVNDDKSVEWRIDLLRVASKFVDRQITWKSELSIDVQEDIEAEEIPVVGSEMDVTVIPQYIGYSKRDGITVDDAFAESIITNITEKGKMIVQKARQIRTLCIQSNREILFEDTESYFGSYLILGGTFCSNSDSLDTIIEALYHLFYEQRKIISKFVDLSEHNCINQIKEMKEERNYSGQPQKISKLQIALYDRFIKLEDIIIDNMLACQPAFSIRTVLAEDIWTEETLNKNIFKALLRVQHNKVYNGKKENELNDGIRDKLSMIYEVKDQTRQGSSSGGKDAGEIDLQICREGDPVAIMEGLKVDSLRREYIQNHIDKVLTYYNPSGCPYVYVIIYAAVKKFAAFWKKCFKYLKDEYIFPFMLKDEIHEINHIYTDSRHAKAVILREDREVSVHFFAVLVN